MGKKKQFINKKSAASFHIIHRTATPDAAAAAASSLSSLSLSSSAAPASSSSSSYYFQPSKSGTAIPAGFPVDLLVAENEEHELAAYRKERRLAVARERDSRDPSLLPHEYDYSAHLREIGGGVFVAAAGAFAYENAASKRERQQREQKQPDVREGRPAVEDQLDREVDWDMVRRAEREGRNKRKRGAEPALGKVPLDVMLALDHDEQVAAEGEEGEEGQFDQLDDDFVTQAMKGKGDTDDEQDDEEEEEKDDDEDDEDDMLAQIRRYEMHEVAEDEDDEEDEDEQDEEGDDEEEPKSGDEDEKAARTNRQGATAQKAKRSLAAVSRETKEGGNEGSGEEEDDDKDSFWDEEDEGEYDEDEQEDEVRPLPSRPLDKDFDRLLSEQYGDEDMGGLDDVDESLVSGQLSIDSFTDSLDAFLSRQSLPVSQGGSDLSLPSTERDTVKRRMVRRLRAMAAEEGQEAPIEQWMSDVYKEVVEDGWDVESIVSTYSNTENHPTAIREKRSQAAVQQQARRREQQQAALAAAITSAVQPEQQDEDGEDGEGEGEDEGDASRNLGVARPRGESAEEKRARKAAGKADKRESRQRKKQLRTLYASIEHQQTVQHTKAIVDNPVGRQLI